MGRVCFVRQVYRNDEVNLITYQDLIQLGLNKTFLTSGKTTGKKKIEAILQRITNEVEETFEVGEWLNFKCILPDHNDSNPSAGININTGQYHCFVCGNKTVHELADLKGWKFKDVVKAESIEDFYRGADGKIYKKEECLVFKDYNPVFYSVLRTDDSIDEYVIIKKNDKVMYSIPMNRIYKGIFSQANLMGASKETALITFLKTIKLTPPEEIVREDIDSFYNFMKSEVGKNLIIPNQRIKNTLQDKDERNCEVEILEEILGTRFNISFNSSNNILDTRTVFETALSTKLQSSFDLIKGWIGFQGIGSGGYFEAFPILVLHHNDPATGKTSIGTKLINMFGLTQGGIVTGDSTLPGIESVAFQLENLPMLVDNFDFEIHKGVAPKILSAAYAHMQRSKFGRGGKETWKSNLIITTNNLPIDKYGWMKSRCVILSNYTSIESKLWDEFLHHDLSGMGKELLLAPKLSMKEKIIINDSIIEHVKKIPDIRIEDRLLNTLKTLTYGLTRYNQCFEISKNGVEGNVEKIVQSYFSEEESIPESKTYSDSIRDCMLEVLEKESNEINTMDEELTKPLPENSIKVKISPFMIEKETGIYYFRVNAMVSAVRKSISTIRRKDLIKALQIPKKRHVIIYDKYKNQGDFYIFNPKIYHPEVINE